MVKNAAPNVPSATGTGAEQVASRLAYELLREGRYSAAIGPVEVPSLIDAAAAGADIAAADAAGFAGIEVQSVGFEEGTEDPAVHIYLTRGTLRLIHSLPQEVEGVRVEVHRMGAITVRPDAAATATNQGNVYERNNRICCGSSCAPTSENCSGTIGALVRKLSDAQVYLISNNHVLAGCNHVAKGQPILAPSSNDGRVGVRSPGEIGRHAEIHELRSGNPNFVNPCEADLALATATQLDVVSSWQGDSTNGYDTPSGMAKPLTNMKVKKFGRTTGLTEGIIEARVSTPMPVTYTSKHFKGTVWFKDVWSIAAAANSPFALPGDSGSLVVTEDAQHAVGVLFAANRTGDYGWIIPMPCVAGSFGGLTLVSNYGV